MPIFTVYLPNMKILLILFLSLVIIAMIIHICRINKEVRLLEAENRKLKIEGIKLQMKLHLQK